MTTPSLPRSLPAPAPARRSTFSGVQPRVTRWRDFDLLVALGALWIVSAIRVAGAAHRHEVFGAEATLAFISMIAIPWLMVKARISHGRLVPSVPSASVTTPASETTPASPALRLVK